VLGALALVMLVGLIVMNLRLRRAAVVPPVVTVPPLPITPGGLE